MKRKRGNKKGYTLIEVIAVFTLTAILLTSVAMMVPSYLRVYTKVNERAHAVLLSDMLVETITSELSNASSASRDLSASLVISDDGTRVEYSNKDGYPMAVYVSDGKLVLYYQPVYDASNTSIVTQAVEWGYKEGVYNQCLIKELQFAKIKNNENLLSMTLTVENRETGYAYTVTRVICCYNLDAAEIM